VFTNTACSPLLEMSAYAFAAQSTIAPFGGLDTVWNAIAAPYTLGEELTWRRIAGVIIIIFGTICSAMFGNHEETTYTVDSLKAVLLTWRTFWYVVGFWTWFFCHGFVIYTHNTKGTEEQPGMLERYEAFKAEMYRDRLVWRETQSPEQNELEKAAFKEGHRHYKNPLEPGTWPPDMWPEELKQKAAQAARDKSAIVSCNFKRGLSMGLMGGTLAGNMFCVKATMALVSASFRDGPVGVWDEWLPYATLGCAIFIAVTNVMILTKGMQENEALFMVSVFEGSMLVANAASGCIVLQEMDNHEPWKAAMYTLCILTVVVGLCVLVSGEMGEDHGGEAYSSLRGSTAAELVKASVSGSLSDVRSSVSIQTSLSKQTQPEGLCPEDIELADGRGAGSDVERKVNEKSVV